MKDLHRDTDELYAATPAFDTLKVMLTLALANRWSGWSLDSGTAFLHAKLPKGKRILAWLLEEQLQLQGCAWELVKTMYGLRVAPKPRQEHFADKRGQHETCVFYYDRDDEPVYALAHADDILAVGVTSSYAKLIQTLGESFLVEDIGDLNYDGSKRELLGRTFTRLGDGVQLKSSIGYVNGLLEVRKLERANSSQATGSSIAKVSVGADSALAPEEHALHWTCVGTIQALAPNRPDIAHVVKELARGLNSPTTHSWTWLRHRGRYLKGTKSYVLALRPQLQLAGRETPLGLEAYVDSDWAGCRQLGKSIMGCAMHLRGTCVGFASKTQGLLALSGGEAELYAIGYGVMEAIFVKNFLREANLAPKVTISMYTNSAAGNSMATRHGAAWRARHIELRYF